MYVGLFIIVTFVVFFAWCIFKMFVKKDTPKKNTTYNGVSNSKENNIFSQR